MKSAGFKLIFTFLLLSGITTAGHCEIDSLFRILEDPSKVCRGYCITDTIIINTWLEIGNRYQKFNPDSAVFCHKTAMELAEKKSSDSKNKIKDVFLLKKGFAYQQLGWDYFLTGNYEEAKIQNDLGKKIAGELQKQSNKIIVAKAKKLMSSCLSNEGVLYHNTGEFDKAIERYMEALQINQAIQNKEGCAGNFANIGGVYYAKSEFPNALEYLFKALKAYEELSNENGKANCLANIGNVNFEMNELDKALEYYSTAFPLYEKLNNEYGQAFVLGNMANIFQLQGNLPKALEYYGRSLEKNQAMGNRLEEARILSNIAVAWRNRGDSAVAAGNIRVAHTEFYPLSISNFEKAIRINNEMEDNYNLASNLGNLGGVYLYIKNYSKAEKLFNDYFFLAKELKLRGDIKQAHFYLHDLYRKTSRFEKALEHYKLHILYRDSLFSEENRKALIEQETKFTYEMKSAKDSIRHAEELKTKDERQKAQNEKQQLELKNKRTQQYFLVGVIGLILVFSGFIYNRFRITKKQKIIIEEKEKETRHQKQIIEEKHKEITDSINYAERIQRSFLATKEVLDKNLSEYFVFFKPKDVVSGDFYFASELNNGNFLLVCADSTGHGVPGAIMSILNISSLEKAIERETEPAKILNEARKLIINRLKKDGSPEGGKDGMDCSLVSFDFKNMKMDFALANNPLWIVRENNIIEFAPDKMPVGRHQKENIPFTQQSTELKKNDLVILLTDGFADQFGGPKGKKFKYSNLQKIIIETTSGQLQTTNEKLQTVFEEWKAWPTPDGGMRELEQVDDLCIIGVRA